MSVGQEFWIVAAGCSGPSSKKDFLQTLKAAPVLGSKGQLADGPWAFNVPDESESLLFGSFDNLIRLTDDLQKHDGQVDGIVHRLERQYLEMEPKADFKIRMRQGEKPAAEKPFLEYLKGWQWDEAKYPKSRAINDNLSLLMNVVNKLDEEARSQTAQYNDLKSQKSNLAKKEGASLIGRELVDVFTPDAVNQKGSAADDFIYTEHLTTVIVILARGAEKEFLASYEKFHESVVGVVPQSAKPFPQLTDKDGNQIWRVVMMKTCAEAFKKQCRERRYLARDYEYSEEAFKKLKEQRSQLDSALQLKDGKIKDLYRGAWSEALVAWVHIKAMRVFVESVLRFGMPPHFASFILSPKANGQTAARKVLDAVLAKGAKAGPSESKKEGDDEEEFFPYVSLSFVPFTAARG